MANLFKTSVDYSKDRALLFSQAWSKIVLGHIASACVLIYLAWDVLPMVWITLWGVWEIIFTPIFLYLLCQKIIKSKSDQTNLKVWEQSLYALFAAIGISWGMFTSFGLDLLNPVHFSMQFAIVAGAAAASSRSLSIFNASFYYYVVPFLTLLSLRVIFLGNEYIFFGILVFIFMIMMCGLSNDTSAALSKYFAVKSDNLALAQKYQAAAEEAQRANAAKTHFLKQADHDLRHPVHAIGLLTTCLRDQNLAPDGYEILDTIELCIDGLSKLFQSMLSITALEAGRIKPEITSFSLNHLFVDTVRQALPEARENNCSIKIVETSLMVKTDRTLLASICQNLVFNAVKYAPNSKILIGVRVKNGYANLHVLDQGQGVAQEYKEIIFDEFVRGPHPDTGSSYGLGLGLTIVKRTAKLLNLNIVFQSVEGVGTHVCIENISITSTQKEDLPAAIAIPPVGLKRGGVLVLHNDITRIGDVDRLLEKWGYTVTIRALGSTLKYEQGDFDALLIIHGPKDKLTALNLDLRRHKPIKNTQIIILNYSTQKSIEALASEYGYWILSAPVIPLQLRSTLLSIQATSTNADKS